MIPNCKYALAKNRSFDHNVIDQLIKNKKNSTTIFGTMFAVLRQFQVESQFKLTIILIIFHSPLDSTNLIVGNYMLTMIESLNV
jgi:hypothetical protein